MEILFDYDKIVIKINVLSFSTAAQLADHFRLRPSRSVTVLQGKEVKVKCESKGVSVTKLQWKKQTITGDVPVPDNMVTFVTDRYTNAMKAILKIAHAKIEDAGLYKCVLTAFGKTDFKRIKITVKG